MRRDFRKTLLQWKSSPLRNPLIVRGARQVGKTYAIRAFGQEDFKNFLEINFEASSQYQLCFETMNPRSILQQLELLSQQKIVPGETLLFLDEIQACPKALQSLRYFKEQLPELHLIAAGSLLEFSMRDEKFSFPVGRIQFAKLYPFSFEEYLDARGDTSLRTALSSFDCASPPPQSLHQHLMERVKEYCIVGGMPAAILAFLKTESFLETKYVQKSLWDAFEADFGKYAKQTQHRYLKKVFEKIPRLIGDRIKYSRIDPELPNPARDIKQAIELLRLSGLLHPVSASSAGGIPLAAGLKEALFKLIFLDIGMIQATMPIDPQYPNLMAGPLAEQLVGQELLALADPFLDTRLFFWTRENSAAEVDYLLEQHGHIYPIEVKAGKSGRLKSLHLFIREKNAPFGIKISQGTLGWDREVLSVPFYLIAHLPRLIDAK